VHLKPTRPESGLTPSPPNVLLIRKPSSASGIGPNMSQPHGPGLCICHSGMGIGHARKQQSFFPTDWRHEFSHGGVLRQLRAGRGTRPLSSRDSIHVVFKVDKTKLRSRSLRSSRCFLITQQTIRKYAKHFGVKLEQCSIQNDHVHLLLRASRRRHFHFFFRVVTGQIAQRLGLEGLLAPSSVTDTPRRYGWRGKLWKFRPFSRVVRSWRAYKITRNYIQLNEKEVIGQIRYQKNRLRGLSSSDWEIL